MATIINMQEFVDLLVGRELIAQCPVTGLPVVGIVTSALAPASGNGDNVTVDVWFDDDARYELTLPLCSVC